MLVIQTRRRLVSYETFGAGRTPVLLIHGNFASPRWWRPLGRVLPGGLLARAPALPGFAGTPLGFEKVTMQALAEDTAEFATATGMERFHVVAHSLGTAVAMELARAAPDRVASLILLAPVPAGGMSELIDGARAPPTLRAFDPRRPFAGAALHLASTVAQALGVHRSILERTLVDMAPRLRADPMLPGLVDDAAAMSPRAIVEMFEALTRFDLRATLHEVRAPTLVIAGEADPLIPLRHARALAARLPRAHLTSYPAVAHGLPIEAPEAVARSLGHFVRFGRWWVVARRWFVLRNMTDVDSPA